MAASSQEPAPQAKQLLSERRFAEAVQVCREALGSEPQNTDVRVLLGMALLAARRYSEARDEMQLAVETTPNSSEGHRLLAEALLRLDELDSAREALEHCLELDPDDVVAAELLDEVLEEIRAEESSGGNGVAETAEGDGPEGESSSAAQRAAGTRRTRSPDPASTEGVAARTAAERSLVELEQDTPVPPAPSSGTEDWKHGAAPEDDSSPHAAAAESTDAPSGSSSPSSRPWQTRKILWEDDGETEVQTPLPSTGGSALWAEEQETDVAASRASDSSSHGQNAADAYTEALDVDSSELESVDEPNLSGGAESIDTADEQDDLPWRNAPADTGSDLHEVSAGSGPSSVAEDVGLSTDLERPEPRKIARWGWHPSRWPQVGSAVLLAAGVAMISGAVALLAWALSGPSDDPRVAAAAEHAARTGQLSDIEDSLRLISEQGRSEPAALARAARLWATAAFEHGVEGASEQADKALQTLEAPDTATSDLSPSAARDARIATVYLALTQGELKRALRVAAALGTEHPEALRAKATVEAVAGDKTEALAFARQAYALRKGSPRHGALYAWLLGQLGDKTRALSVLDELADGETSPAVRLARALVLSEGGQVKRMAREAREVLGALEPLASEHEQGWAHLVLAQHALEEGDRGTALSHARAAAPKGPSFREDFVLAVSEILHQLGAFGAARELLQDLPEQSAAPDARATLRVKTALDAADTASAQQAVEEVDSEPLRDFLKGLIAQERGDLSAAQRHLEAAARDAELFAKATYEIGQLALQRGEPRKAVELLRDARRSAPQSSAVVALLARALLELDRVDQAERELASALDEKPNDVRLVQAMADVHRARGDERAAFDTVREALRNHREDPELQAAFGFAALRLGKAEEARQAFRAALRYQPDYPEALVGLAQWSLSQGNLEEAQERMAEAQAGSKLSPAAQLVRAQLQVLEGQAHQAIPFLRKLTRSAGSARAWSLLGQALLQVERFVDATEALERTLRLDRTLGEAHLGLAQAAIRAGRLGAASRHVAQAEQAFRREGSPRRWRALTRSVQAQIRFEYGSFAQAKRLAEQALATEPENTRAHLVLAALASEQGKDPTSHLRRATEGLAPPAEAWGLLATKLGPSKEGCRVAKRYLKASPAGIDAPQVKKVLARCK